MLEATDAVASAVAASMSIPFFFRPFRMDRMELVDGGLLSNFPAWLFDNERTIEEPFTPTYGFKLVTRLGESASRSAYLSQNANGRGPEFGIDEANRLPKFVRDLFVAVFAGDDVLETRQIEDLYIVPLHVSVETLDFDLSPQKKDTLYLQGRDGARTFFVKEVPQDKQDILNGLKVAYTGMVKHLGVSCSHLRMNVALHTTRKRLRIAHSLNMDEDADDRLEFNIEEGACGLCWQQHDFVICDLDDARTTFATKYKMTKYQQAMVRSALRSLLCVPIFDAKEYNPRRRNSDNPLVGVLSFDSDDNLIAEFSTPPVREHAENTSRMLARLLRS
jgi:NTE family protein